MGIDVRMDRAVRKRHSRNRRHKKLWIAIMAAILLLLAAPVTAYAVIVGFGKNTELVTEGDKLREGKAVNDVSVLGGAELTMLQNQSKGQMMSFLLETKEGSLIVIDGGRWDDSDYLTEQIKKRGGRVSAWFLTHTHTDHVGALLKILQGEADGQDSGIEIDKIYYNFAPREWYALHEPEDMGTAYTIIGLLEGLPDERIQVVHQGDVIAVDEVKFTVMNDRYEPDENHVGENDCNDSCMIYRAVVNDVSILFLADLGELGGNRLLEELGAEALRSDMVQMAHHGQNGVGENVYRAVDPSVCLWPTPQWLWDNEGDRFKTPETKGWMKKLDVDKHYCIKDGDQVIR